MAGPRALYFALAPTLLVYGTMNWDLLAVAFATAGLLYFLLRDETSGRRDARARGRGEVLPGAAGGARSSRQRLRERRPDAAITLGWATALAPGRW